TNPDGKSGSLTNGFAITDGIRPGTITNLAVVATTTTSITLTWTASGDDGYTGTATGYDLKIATFTITEANWDSAARIQGIANPKLSGGTESFIVSNLSSGVTYYFALKAQDDAGLKSVISNVAKAVTLGLIWQKGVSYTSWWYDSYNSQDSDTSIENLGTTGTKWVSLLVTWYQDTNVSTTIYRDTQRTPDDAGLIRAINKIHSLGMKVMLKPHVDIKDDTWRGAIEPSDWNAWFGSYTDFINYYADFAQNNGVEQLCIGCELEKTVSHETEWRKVIEGVRSRFTKPITYAANWDGYDKVNFWDVLDYAGVDAYYPLTDKDNPTIPELMEGCNKWAGSLTLWQQTINKPVIFAEIGYRSIDGVNKHPWEWTGTGTIDLQEQADCYESAFQVFWGKPWFYGMYWWNWDTNPNQGGMTDPNYTPHNKPAEDILCGWYKGIQPQPLNISSNTGINIGTTSVIINGTYFRFGADVRLVKNGSIILGTTTVVIPSGTITTLFDLAGKEPEIWDVVVTNPDGKSGTLTGGFTITKPIIDISGNNQTGTVAATLTSFVVKVTDTYGNPIVGHTVHWQIINSPVTASLSAATTTTGTNGTTLSSLTLGTKSGTYKVTATSGSMEEAPLAQATFTATATPGTASILSEVTSNNQTGTVATTLTPFVVKVTDTYGNPIAGHIVHWQIIDTMAGASLSAATTTTGTDGTTLSSLTLGTKSGTYKVTATSDSTEGAPLAQATFTATATPDTASLVEISAVPATILKGGTFTLTIIPKDKNGNVIQSQGTVTLSNLTTSLLPAISNIHAATTLVATITLSPNRGRDVITATVTIGANHVSGTCSILVLLPKEQGDIAVVLPQGTATANGTFTENFWIEIEDKSDAGILTLLSGQIGVAVEITMGTETGGTITGTLPTTIFVEIPFDSTKL
ncbi:hypothetical protein KKE26_04210, partial [bacterium]|nr:hypothetical protein [bacterium]